MSSATRCPICEAALGKPRIKAPDRLHGGRGEHRISVCPSCGAGVTFPQVGDERLADFYPSDYGPYDERMSAVERLASRTIRAFQGWNALRTQPLAALRERPIRARSRRGLRPRRPGGDARRAAAGRCPGVEPSPPACAAAAARGIDVRCGTLATVALEPESYDAVVFRHSLEHTNDPVDGAAAASGPRLRPAGSC